jgi:type IV pilus assembly protein PilB
MSTAPTPNDPKKPTPPAGAGTPKPAVPGAKPAAPGTPPAAGAKPPTTGTPPQKPATPGTPGTKPPVPGAAKPAVPGAAKPPVPGAPKPATPGVVNKTPAGGTAVPKPAAGAGAKPPAAGSKPVASGSAPRPQPQKPKHTHIDSTSRQLGQKLVDLGYLDDAQLESIYDEMRTSELKVGELAIQRGLLNDDQLLQATAEVHGMRVSTLEDVKPSPEAIKIVPQNMAELYKMVPLTFESDVLTVAMSDPNNLMAIDDIKNFLSVRNVSPVLAPAAAVEALMKKAYGGPGTEESLGNLIQQLEKDESIGRNSMKRETSIDLDDLQEMANSAPVRKLINMVMLMAIRDKASDIHFEPFEEEYKMRYKCDGVLLEMVPPPRHLANAIASRIKVMANLDIAERRMPQDGRIELTIGGNRVDMRVSVLPTMFGESVVIRVLDKGNVGLSLDKIGMPPELLAEFRQVIRKPNGIVLVTGPTGSGKTTTLYSALTELNDIDTKLITTEDPVEYEIDGIIQCPINHEIDLTFASALRAILRQDPDICLIGEIRDLETAQIAIQASLTGHLVFSTLHTNDAPSSITRLRDMGCEPFLITACLEAIQAQRLVRKVCQFCRTWFEPTRDQMMELNLTPEEARGKKMAFGEGCDKCNSLGFKGRTGLYELMMINDDLRDMIGRGASTDQLRDYGKTRGMRTLREDGLRKLFDGMTTVEEIVREVVIDD